MIQSYVPLKLQKVSDEILFNFRNKKLLSLSAKLRSKKDDGTSEYLQISRSDYL